MSRFNRCAAFDVQVICMHWHSIQGSHFQSFKDNSFQIPFVKGIFACHRNSWRSIWSGEANWNPVASKQFAPRQIYTKVVVYPTWGPEEAVQSLWRSLSSTISEQKKYRRETQLTLGVLYGHCVEVQKFFQVPELDQVGVKSWREWILSVIFEGFWCSSWNLGMMNLLWQDMFQTGGSTTT